MIRPDTRTRGVLAVLATLAAVLAPPQPAIGSSMARGPRLSWPFEPAPRVTRPFDPPQHRYGTGHRGVDLAATSGEPVLAADAGVVIFAGMLAGRGVLSIQHDGGLRTTYEPVAPSVREGSRVYRGQVIGTVRPGHPGCSAPACLHWGVRRGEHQYLDPLTLVRTGAAGRPIRLKPWD